jgi:hypothetical protein
MPFRPIALAVALVAAAGLATSALASRTAHLSATMRCFNFTVVQPDPAAKFAAGVYQRQNFSPNNSLSCNTAFDVLRSYLYDPQSHRGWSVGPLVGPLRNATGRRFVQNGTGGSTGFNVFRNGTPPKPANIVRTIAMTPNTTKTYAITIPTRTADVGESVSLVGTSGAVIQQTGFNIQGANTVYYARVQTFDPAGSVRFTLLVQGAKPSTG